MDTLDGGGGWEGGCRKKNPQPQNHKNRFQNYDNFYYRFALMK